MRMKLIQVKVDEHEHEKIRSFAEERHEAMSAYIRKAALSFPEYGKEPISYETQHDRENKAKVREGNTRSRLSLGRFSQIGRPGFVSARRI